ncbi:flagellar hook-basal body complex protein FliE [Algirhabdus cladophorae]|uniref:flagellar hook-basal body complex protein FliE n=1 Tax=Algirhabdus cladophorae TaxID=3377108 RepID=UPI003B84AB23
MEQLSSIAAQKYASIRGATAPSPESAGQIGESFHQVAENFANTLGEGEKQAMAAMSGDANPHALVQALTQAELAVETAVTVRNKVVEAYQEILRMPV